MPQPGRHIISFEELIVPFFFLPSTADFGFFTQLFRVLLVLLERGHLHFTVLNELVMLVSRHEGARSKLVLHAESNRVQRLVRLILFFKLCLLLLTFEEGLRARFDVAFLGAGCLTTIDLLSEEFTDFRARLFKLMDQVVLHGLVALAQPALNLTQHLCRLFKGCKLIQGLLLLLVDRLRLGRGLSEELLLARVIGIRDDLLQDTDLVHRLSILQLRLQVREFLRLRHSASMLPVQIVLKFLLLGLPPHVLQTPVLLWLILFQIVQLLPGEQAAIVSP